MEGTTIAELFKLDAGNNTIAIGGTLITTGRRVQVDRYTANQTLDADNHHVFGNTDGGAFTISLPAGVNETNYRIVNTGTSGNSLTITPNGAENLLGANSIFILLDGESLIITFETTDHWY